MVAAEAKAAAAPAAEEDDDKYAVEALPEKDPFVNVGSSFKVGDKLCIIEAMKTFNEIEAEVSGKIVKVLVDDASPVDYEQPLFLVEPA